MSKFRLYVCGSEMHVACFRQRRQNHVMVPPVFGTENIATVLIIDDAKFQDTFLALELADLRAILEGGYALHIYVMEKKGHVYMSMARLKNILTCYIIILDLHKLEKYFLDHLHYH